MLLLTFLTPSVRFTLVMLVIPLRVSLVKQRSDTVKDMTKKTPNSAQELKSAKNVGSWKKEDNNAYYQ